MKNFTLVASILLAAASLAFAHGEPDVKHEHAGNVFKKVHGNHFLGDVVLNDGNCSTGETITIGNESLYLTYPRHQNTSNAILYLTDIFGNALINNRLLADNLAKAGYFVVMPDLFRGDPVPADALTNPDSTFNMTAWRARHPQSDIEVIIDATLTSMRGDLGVSKIAAAGYCFGGRYVALYLAAGKGVEVGFTAHPSGTTSDEWAAVAGPISIAFGALDASNTPENRTNIEGIFEDGNKTYQTSLYSGAEHGFAVRTNLTDKRKAFAQESAYFQAVRWFDAWVKDEV